MCVCVLCVRACVRACVLCARACVCVRACVRACVCEDAVASTMIMEDLRGQPPAKRVRRECRLLQDRLRTLCQDRLADRKTVAELLR